MGKAVVRNRVKRRLRAALREIGLKDGMDYVVIGSTAVAGVPFSRLRVWLRDAVALCGAGKEAV